MKLCIVTAALVAMASTTPAVAARSGLRRRELVGDINTAFEEDVLSPHYQRRLHCTAGAELSCVKSCREKNKCQSSSGLCTKSCRAKCCEISGQGIIKPPNQERKCDQEKEKNCFKECRVGQGDYGEKKDCTSDNLSGSQQQDCVERCRDECCDWENPSVIVVPPFTPPIKENRSEPAPIITKEPTPRPTSFPTPKPTRSPTKPPTLAETRQDTFPPTPGPTTAVCTTKMNADILCTVKGVTDENGQPVDCKDENIVSRSGTCDVTFEYCYTASHDGEDCLEVIKFETAMGNSREDRTQEFRDTKTNGDGKMCEKRANPVQMCEEVPANVCECDESKTTMRVEAMEANNAVCFADDKFDIKKCDECDIEVDITCQAFNPLTNEFGNDCSEQAQSQFVIAGTEECEERVKLCYTVTNIGPVCASWEDLDTNLSRTIVSGGMVKTDDVKASNDKICPGESVSICEEQEVNSCSCMKVEVEVVGENPKNKECVSNAEYNFCKVPESKQDGGSAEAPGPSKKTGGSKKTTGGSKKPSGSKADDDDSKASKAHDDDSKASKAHDDDSKASKAHDDDSKASKAHDDDSKGSDDDSKGGKGKGGQGGNSGGSKGGKGKGGGSDDDDSKGGKGKGGGNSGGSKGGKGKGGSKSDDDDSKGKGGGSGGSKGGSKSDDDDSKGGKGKGGKGGKGKGGGNSGGSKGGKGKGGGSDDDDSKGGKGKGGGNSGGSKGGKGKGGSKSDDDDSKGKGGGSGGSKGGSKSDDDDSKGKGGGSGGSKGGSKSDDDDSKGGSKR